MPRGRPGRVLAAAVIALAVAGVFGAALGHGFLPSHDDGAYVVWNPIIRAPLAEALRGAFTTAPLGAWAPLHVLSHALDHALWGDRAGGYVLGNLVLHALCAGLLGLLVTRLGGPPLAALAAALLFAVHPVQVEAVVWISQRKSVLSLALVLAALHLWIGYARAAPGRRAPPYLLALAAAVAASLTKAVAVVIPLALALLDVPLGRTRPRGRWVVEKLPFVAVAAALAVATALTKGEATMAVTVAGHSRLETGAGGLAWHGGSPLATALTMATVLPRYLRLLLWPAELSAVYLPSVHTGLGPEVLLSLGLLAGLLAAGGWLLRRQPRLFLWYALFFLGLLPVSQLVPQTTLMNDRYLYVPMTGAAALAGEGLALALAGLGSRSRLALGAAACAALLGLALQARARVPVWRGDLTLWSDTVTKAPGSPYAWYNLARAREALGDDEGALAGYERALSLDPLDGDAAVNAGAILLRRGELARAEPLVVSGAERLGDSVEAQFNLGLLRFLQGRLREAEPALRRAHALDPAACTPASLLGHVLSASGRAAEALELRHGAAAAGCADADGGRTERANAPR